MTIWQRQLPQDIWLLGLQGRLDQSQTPQLEAQLTQLLDQDGRSRLIIDLSEVTYVNSGGLRCLVSAWRKARQQTGDLILVGLSSRLQEIFAMVGFDKVFQIVPHTEEAQAILEEKT
ncbi:MAG: STAS domain-containing protein [Ardenticatenaceae bacterium]|nr:STAS domain-containing protein [Ardenticatenaceae bacterium]